MPRRSALWSGDPRDKPPFGVAEIAWGHPLGAYFQNGFLLDEFAGTPTPIGRICAPIASRTPSWVTNAAGVTIRSAAGDAQISYGAAFEMIPVGSGSFTCVVRGHPRVSNQTGGFFGKASNGFSGGSNTSWGFGLGNGTPGELDCINFAAGGVRDSWYTFNTDSDWTPGRPSSLSMTYDNSLGVNARWAVQVDGASVVRNGTNNEGTSATVSSGSNFQLTGPCGQANSFDGDIVSLFGFAPALPRNLIQWLAAEPYAMLRPIVRRRYFVPAAAEIPQLIMRPVGQFP